MALESNREHIDKTAMGKVLRLLSTSISLQIALLGILFIVSGYFIQFIEVRWTHTGVWAGVFAIWGTALFLFGLLLYLVIWRSYQ